MLVIKPNRFEFVISLKTVEALNLTIQFGCGRIESTP